MPAEGIPESSMALTQLISGANRNASSVGAAWPPYFDSNSLRIKGICKKVVGDRKTLEGVVFAPARNVEKEHPSATRTTMRAFVRRGLIEEIKNDRDGSEYRVEAVIPADNFMQDYCLAYFGRNSQERTPDEEVRKEELGNLANVITTVNTATHSQAIARAAAGKYSISVPLNGNVHNERDVERLLALYQEAYQLYTFPINRSNIRLMIGGENQVIVARTRDGEIASALVVEMCRISLNNGKTALLAELSDFATFKSHRGAGLMTALQFEAVRMVRNMQGGEEAIIYSENRAPWDSVNASSLQAGHKLAGFLPFHCTIMGDKRDVDYRGINKRYETLNVFYAENNVPALVVP
jgi:hypothetical protein